MCVCVRWLEKSTERTMLTTFVRLAESVINVHPLKYHFGLCKREKTEGTRTKALFIYNLKMKNETKNFGVFYHYSISYTDQIT